MLSFMHNQNKTYLQSLQRIFLGAIMNLEKSGLLEKTNSGRFLVVVTIIMMSAHKYITHCFLKKDRAIHSPVRSAHIAGFASRGFEDIRRDGLCGDNTNPELYPTLDTAAYVNKLIIKDINHDGKDDVIFFTTEQNCKTKKVQKKQRSFMNIGDRFIEKGRTSR